MWLFKRNKLPSRKFIEKLCTVSQFTPDEALLEGHPYHLVFIYGRGMPLAKITDAFTIPKMSMWNKRLEKGGMCSAVAMSVPSGVNSRIHGGLYAVTTKQLVRLDNKWQNGICFNRKRVRFNTPHLNADGALNPVEAYMYIGNNDYWERQIEWDLSYWKGYGKFCRADLVHGIMSDIPELMNLEHFTYTAPNPPPFELSKTPHMRNAKLHEDVRALDMKFEEQEERLKSFTAPKVDDKQISFKQATVS